MMLETPSFRQTLPQKNRGQCTFHHKLFCAYWVQFSAFPQLGLEPRPPIVKWVFFLELLWLFKTYLQHIYIYKYQCIYKYQKHYFLFFNISSL